MKEESMRNNRLAVLVVAIFWAVGLVFQSPVANAASVYTDEATWGAAVPYGAPTNQVMFGGSEGEDLPNGSAFTGIGSVYSGFSLYYTDADADGSVDELCVEPDGVNYPDVGFNFNATTRSFAFEVYMTGGIYVGAYGLDGSYAEDHTAHSGAGFLGYVFGYETEGVKIVADDISYVICFGPIEVVADADGDNLAGDVDCGEVDNDLDGDSACDDCDDEDYSLTSQDADGDLFSGCAGDCNDTDVSAYPGAIEVCDGYDNDCDGLTDGDDPDAAGSSCYDDDGDGWTGRDCDDADSSVYPGATEVCDGEDDDCDGSIDEGTECYDDDGDGYTENAGDCDDADADANPSATEVCDSVDNDCDGTADDAATDAVTWCEDADSDGYSTASRCVTQCDRPSSTWSDTNPITDCDDADVSVNPGAIEVCDSVDNDCDGTVDDSAVDAVTWYADVDSDGYGDLSVSVVDCSAPTGYVASADDCNDADATVNPGATEVCDAVDNDCNGSVDEEVPTWYLDSDVDGYGDPVVSEVACSAPTGYIADGTDCDDADATVNPGAAEVCDDLDADEDCDGLVDDLDPDVNMSTWYADADGDTYGDSTVSAIACSQPTGYIADGTDCNDTDSAVNPGAAEAEDGLDQDCDGIIDEGTDAYDDDVDGWTEDDGDCDDADFAVNPGAVEVCDNLADDDCDREVDDFDVCGGDTADTGVTPPSYESARGCSCSSTSTGKPSGALFALLTLAALVRRRRR